MKAYLSVLLIFLGSFSYAQSLDKPAQIGFKVVDLSFNLLNHNEATARLSQFRDKLVILDFWATWCSACTARFPHLDSLQEEFKNSLEVILVNSSSTGDTRLKIQNFLSKQDSLGNSIRLKIATEDQQAKKLFPGQFLPYCAWIDQNGKLLAVTNSDFITRENIKKLLIK